MIKSTTKILIAVAIADMLAAIDSTAVIIALPKISEVFNLSTSNVSLIQLLYTLSLIVVLIPIGSIGDVSGHKKNFLLGLLLFGFSSFLIIFSPNFFILLALRLLQGTAAGILYTAGGALIAHHWKKTELAFGVTAGFFSIGMLIGPIIGGVLTDSTLFGIQGWHLIFAINIPLTVFSYILIKNNAEETKKSKELGRFDTLGLILLITILSTLVLLLIQDNYRAPLGIYALLSIIMFALYESKIKKPLVSLSIFKNQNFSTISIFTGVSMFSLVGLSFLNTFYLQNILGKTATEAGFTILPISLGMGIFSVIAASFRNWKLGCIISSILMMLGLLWLSRVDPSTSYFKGLFWGYFLVSAGAGFMMTNTFAAALGSVPEKLSGIAAGYINTVQQIGGLAGIGFIAGLNITKDYQQIYLYLFFIVTIGLIASFFVKTIDKNNVSTS